MKPEQRLLYLKIGAGAMLALAILIYWIIPPAIDSWKDQTDRIATLKKNVTKGDRMLGREDQLRQTWADMVHANLPQEDSAAENLAIKAVARWARDSGVTFNNLAPSWQDSRDTKDPYRVYECRLAATGDQASLSRFIYELETDPLPVALEECEITARDTHGSQLSMTARFSFLHLPEKGVNGK